MPNIIKGERIEYDRTPGIIWEADEKVVTCRIDLTDQSTRHNYEVDAKGTKLAQLFEKLRELSEAKTRDILSKDASDPFVFELIKATAVVTAMASKDHEEAVRQPHGSAESSGISIGFDGKRFYLESDTPTHPEIPQKTLQEFDGIADKAIRNCFPALVDQMERTWNAEQSKKRR
jgi:hypothetical protein